MSPRAVLRAPPGFSSHRNFRREFSRAVFLFLHGGFPRVHGSALRRAGRRAIADPVPLLLRPLARFVMALCWPFTAWRDAGRIARDRADPPLRMKAFRTAMRENVDPAEFTAYDLERPGAAPASDWLYQAETRALLSRLAEPEAKRLAADKLAFHEFCRERGFTTVPILSVAGPGHPEQEPQIDAIVLKPRRGARGEAVAIFQRTAGGWQIRGGQPSAWRTIADALPCEHIVQPLISPHPAVAGLPGPAASAARIVTGLHPDGRVNFISALFAAPRSEGGLSNGGPRRRVDRTGALVPGRLDPDRRLEGVVLPNWPEAVDLCLAAHRAFPARAVMLGWDVAFSPDGPLLIEANAGIGFYLEQTESRRPMGTGPAGRLLNAWIA